jgi:hypothetical protein
VSVGAFHKRIDNPVFTSAYVLRNTTYEGMNFSSLSFSGPQNARAAKFRASSSTTSSSSRCSPVPSTASASRSISTLADSEERDSSAADGEAALRENRRTRFTNVALFYEKYGFEGRIGYTFTGDFISPLAATSTATPTSRSARSSTRSSATADEAVQDLRRCDQPRSGAAQRIFRLFKRMSATEIYWWTANFGVNWKL